VRNVQGKKTMKIGLDKARVKHKKRLFDVITLEL
jgi:hypothetical protein